MSDIKEKCDNDCNTCPEHYRLFCALQLAKQNRDSLNEIKEQIAMIGQAVVVETKGPVIMPDGCSHVSTPQARKKDGEECDNLKN